MRELVRLKIRPSRDGKTFKYLLDYVDEDGKRHRVSLGHADKRKAERQRVQKERELRMGVVAPESMKLSDFLKDSLARTGKQIRESTQHECRYAMQHFIEVVGDNDYQRISLKHGELFRQACLDQGNSPATVAKKLRHLKRLFQLAVERKQLEENPLRYVKSPKSPKKKVEIFTPDECEHIVQAAQHYQTEVGVKWELLIIIALTTAMRRGELFNVVWQDIDFAAKTIDVAPKKDTAETWEWHIKDTDRRTLPLTEDVIVMLSSHQAEQPDGYPYVFVPPCRYDRVQQLRKQGKWTMCSSRQNLIHNFTRQFGKILKRARIKRSGQFHDLRRTALSNWFASGMSVKDVMVLAGHSSFDTTNRFYLAVADDLIDRARQATTQTIGKNLARSWRASSFVSEKD